MYGVPKFRQNLFMKYKKEVLLSVGAVLTIATVVRFVPGQDEAAVKAIEAQNQNMIAVEEVKPVIGYKMIINGTEVGVIADELAVDELVRQAYEDLILELGYDPELTAEPALIEVYEGELTLDTSTIVDELKTQLMDTLGVVKQKAFVMRIGDDFTVALESEEAVKEVLCNAQAKIINTNAEFEIDLDENEHNTMIMTPKLLMIDPDSVNEALSTTGNEEEAADGSVVETEETGEEADSEDVTDETVVEADETDTEATEDEASDEEASEEEEIPEPEPGTLVEIEFAEDIAIVEAFVEPSDIVDVDTATELITKENEEEKTYEVVSGDNPWQIAIDNEMSLDDLYKMNPELEAQERSMQVGDELIVMVPEPELKVETKVEIVYEVPIARGTAYVNDPETYVGRNTTIDNGSDGVLEVTALLTKLNGEEIDREIIGETRLVEPTNQVISKGTKAFPVKGATGSYIFPVTGYVVTSPYGYRWGSFHHGIDLALATGNPIMAADGGTVTFAGWKSSTYGYMVEIDHGDGVSTRYAHCSKVLVTVGQAVAKGEDIAKVGSTGRSTGPHVHFEIRFDGVAANPSNYLE